MVKITDVIYKLLGQAHKLKTLEFLKLINDNKDKSGWTRLTYEDFQRSGLFPDTLKRVLKECKEWGIIEIEENEREKGTKKGAVPRKYRLKFTPEFLKRLEKSSD